LQLNAEPPAQARTPSVMSARSASIWAGQRILARHAAGFRQWIGVLHLLRRFCPIGEKLARQISLGGQWSDGRFSLVPDEFPAQFALMTRWPQARHRLCALRGLARDGVSHPTVHALVMFGMSAFIMSILTFPTRWKLRQVPSRFDYSMGRVLDRKQKRLLEVSGIPTISGAEVKGAQRTKTP
jgi:hypothetical protein